MCDADWFYRICVVGLNGPVVWPDVEAIVVVPISAHALFSRPLVIGPNGEVDVELVADSPAAVAWCDGGRMIDVPPGARRGPTERVGNPASPACTLRHLQIGSSPSSTFRLAAGEGEMSRGRCLMIEFLKLHKLGIIEDAHIDLWSWTHRDYRRNGAGRRWCSPR